MTQIEIASDLFTYMKDMRRRLESLERNATFIGTPIGSITAFGSSTAPGGWINCNGAAISRTDYSALFNVIGTTYGVGNGSTTFNLPQLSGRFPLGNGATPGGDGTTYTLASTGGLERVVLTQSDIPEHTHDSGTLATNSGGSHSHSTYANQTTNTTATGAQNRLTALGGSGSNNSGSTSTDGSHSHTMTGSTGAWGGFFGAGTTSHQNMPPYQVVNYIIKFA
jgi:microcystin-dependent protein